MIRLGADAAREEILRSDADEKQRRAEEAAAQQKKESPSVRLADEHISQAFAHHELGPTVLGDFRAALIRKNEGQVNVNTATSRIENPDARLPVSGSKFMLRRDWDPSETAKK